MKHLLFICLLAQTGFAAEARKVELKKTSTFTLQDGDRNPFWPIGWKPAGAGQAEAAGPSIPPSSFSVTSITLDPGAHFAIINGKVMAEGQQFGLQMGGQIQQLTVKSIQDGKVVLAHGGEEIVVPLRRR
ncbi:MAG: hypothetical protein DLM52_05685 [Chthoniobacterales bacterium]|nr:MAG: hypothetical protein DLM52_05685 [Chthoniobacterales bacterium]